MLPWRDTNNKMAVFGWAFAGVEQKIRKYLSKPHQIAIDIGRFAREV